MKRLWVAILSYVFLSLFLFLPLAHGLERGMEEAEHWLSVCLFPGAWLFDLEAWATALFPTGDRAQHFGLCYGLGLATNLVIFLLVSGSVLLLRSTPRQAARST